MSNAAPYLTRHKIKLMYGMNGIHLRVLPTFHVGKRRCYSAGHVAQLYVDLDEDQRKIVDETQQK